METCSLVQMYLTKLVLHFYFYFCSYVCLIYTVDGSSQRVPLFLLRCTYDVVSTVCVQNRKKQKKHDTVWHALRSRHAFQRCQTVYIYMCQGCAITAVFVAKSRSPASILTQRSNGSRFFLYLHVCFSGRWRKQECAENWNKHDSIKPATILSHVFVLLEALLRTHQRLSGR